MSILRWAVALAKRGQWYAEFRSLYFAARASGDEPAVAAWSAVADRSWDLAVEND